MVLLIRSIRITAPSANLNFNVGADVVVSVGVGVGVGVGIGVMGSDGDGVSVGVGVGVGMNVGVGLYGAVGVGDTFDCDVCVTSEAKQYLETNVQGIMRNMTVARTIISVFFIVHPANHGTGYPMAFIKL